MQENETLADGGSDNQAPVSDPNLGWLDTYDGCWNRAVGARRGRWIPPFG